MIRHIERVSRLSPATFASDFVAKQRPVVIGGMMEGQPLDAIRTREAALEAYKDVESEVTENEIEKQITDTMQLKPTTPKRIGFAEYIRDYQGTRTIMIFNNQRPEFASIARTIPLVPELASVGRDDVMSPQEYAVYLANAGSVTHMHWDEHMYHNLLYQVFGTKRVVLFPDSSSHALAPVAYWSGMFLQHMPREQQTQFIDYAGGYVCEIQPGDALFIPGGMWHYVEYPETAMSVSFRFARSDHNSRLAALVGYYQSTSAYQHIACGLNDDASIAPGYMEAYQKIEAACFEKYPDFSTRFRTLQRLLTGLCRQLCPEKLVPFSWSGPVQGIEEQIAAGKRLAVSLLAYRFDRFLAAGDVAEARAAGAAILKRVPSHERIGAAMKALPA